jgi:hypothetical protein
MDLSSFELGHDTTGCNYGKGDRYARQLVLSTAELGQIYGICDSAKREASMRVAWT